MQSSSCWHKRGVYVLLVACVPMYSAALLQAVKAESFNPRTLFLFGTYTIGKERLFLEVARTIGKKVGEGTGGRLGHVQCGAGSCCCVLQQQAGDHDSCIAAGSLVGLGPYWTAHYMLRSRAPALH